MHGIANSSLAPHPFQAVILDYGQVLCHKPTAEHVERMASVFELRPEALLPLWGRNRDAYDRGDVDAEAYWEEMAREAKVSLNSDQIADLRRWDVEMWARINPTMVDWLGRLRQGGMKTALLSNMHPDMIAFARAHFDWLKAFDFLAFSADLRLTKPHPAIYRRTLQALGVEPAQALFVDDLERNIQAARELGIRAVRFESVAGLKSDLEAIGFPLLPDKA